MKWKSLQLYNHNTSTNDVNGSRQTLFIKYISTLTTYSAEYDKC